MTYTAIRKTAIDYSIPIFYPDEITLFGQGSSRMTSARIHSSLYSSFPNYIYWAQNYYFPWVA